MLQVPDPQLGLVVRGLARAWGEKQYAETPFAWHSCWTPACQGLNTFLTAPCPSWLSFALDPLGPVPCPSPPPRPPCLPGAGWQLVVLREHPERWAVNFVVTSCWRLIKEPLEMPRPSCPRPGRSMADLKRFITQHSGVRGGSRVTGCSFN